MTLGRFSLAAQASVVAACVLGILYATQLAWLARGGDPHVVLLLPVVVCTIVVWGYTKAVHAFRLRGLAIGFERLAAGDLQYELPPAPDAESQPLKESWTRMRSALRDLTGRLRRVDASRRQLFADLAHELGTPIGTVLALADALALPDIDASPERRRELVSALVGEALRLARLVGDVRDLAELDDPDIALRIAPTDLGALARAVARRLELARQGSAPIEVDAPEGMLAPVDAERMEQVLVNVLVNAQRHTPPSGAITMRLAEAGAQIRLVVDDSGGGVPDELLATLGERLTRIDASRSRRTGGSGLGLSIVRAIVQRHGGSLEFERAPSGGLRVAIALDASASAPPHGDDDGEREQQSERDGP